MAYHVLHRRWPCGKRVWWPLLLCELGLLIPILVLFGIEQPDLYRTKFWKIGYNYGFNSNPNIVIFAMVNGQPLPKVPFVWSQALTNFNVAISVLNLFVLLAKMVVLIMKVYFPLIGLVVSTVQVILWTVSLYGQMGPDYADPDHPSHVAWYISKSCQYAKPYGLEGSCRLAKATLAVTVVILFLMVVNMGLAIWGMLPRENANIVDEDDEDEDDHGPSETKHINVEMYNMGSPGAPQAPGQNLFTPRTEAFNTLNQRGGPQYG